MCDVDNGFDGDDYDNGVVMIRLLWRCCEKMVMWEDGDGRRQLWQSVLATTFKEKNVCRSFRGIGGVRPAGVLVVS